MSEHPPTPESTTAGFLNLVVGVILVGIIAGIAWYVANAPRVPEVTEEAFRNVVTEVDTERLKKERQEKYGEPDLSAAEAEIETLREEAIAANLMQFDAKGRKEIHDARVSTNYAANEVITKVDMEGFMAAGRPVFEKCREGFEQLMEAIRTGELEPQQARRDPGPDFEEYRKYCGRAYPALEDHGLVQNGEWVNPEVGPHIFEILNRLRWAGVLDMRKRPSEQITPYELELFTIWRAGTGALPAERRVELVNRAATVAKDLPRWEIIGNIYFDAGQSAKAIEAYEKACAENPDDLFLQKKCAWLAAKVKGGPAQGGESDS